MIFAGNDQPRTSHADQLIVIARDVFGHGDSFVAKITGRLDRPLQRNCEFRNRKLPAVSPVSGVQRRRFDRRPTCFSNAPRSRSRHPPKGPPLAGNPGGSWLRDLQAVRSVRQRGNVWSEQSRVPPRLITATASSATWRWIARRPTPSCTTSSSGTSAAGSRRGKYRGH